MAFFKYTVANNKGKKLSGSVEAPNEKIARKELNNLGFSILSIEETETKPKAKNNKLVFIFEAIDKNGKIINGTIPASSESNALLKLKDQYDLKVTALWEEHATAEEIRIAKIKRTKDLEKELMEEEIQKEKKKKLQNAQQEKRKEFIKIKIDTILTQTDVLLKKFNDKIDKDKKALITKQINKILRIKQSQNLEYILATAEDLLKLIKDQEKIIKLRGNGQERYQYKEETRKILVELRKQQKAKTLSEDIVSKLEIVERKMGKGKTSAIKDKLKKIKNFFKKPAEIIVLEESIKHKNNKLIKLIKLYFTEPTKEYKNKVKNDIKKTWASRKKTKHILKQAKKLLRQRGLQFEEKTIKTNSNESFFQELNTITGFLLTIYITYYIIALYLTTKNFGLKTIPKPFYIYESRIFKYLITIFFILHATTSIKINFFKNTKLAEIALIPIFIITSTLIILNF